MIFFIIYYPNASANNEIQAVFHFGLFIIRFSSKTILLIEPYDLMILCMLKNISSEFCCFGKAKRSFMYTRGLGLSFRITGAEFIFILFFLQYDSTPFLNFSPVSL